MIFLIYIYIHQFKKYMTDFIKEPGDIEVKYGASHQGVWKVIICRQTIR